MPESYSDVSDLHQTDAPARRHTPHQTQIHVSSSTRSKRAEDDSLFRDPFMAGPIDFESEFGFKQAGKKNKKAAAKKANAWEDEDEKKDDAEGDDQGNKDSGGDAGAGAGDGSGDKKDEEKKDDENGGDPAADDDWGFAPAKKKKGKKGKTEDTPAPEPAASKFDAFTEIKLDDTGPMLDLSFDTGGTDTKSAGTGFGAWGSSWTTGATTTRLVRSFV